MTGSSLKGLWDMQGGTAQLAAGHGGFADLALMDKESHRGRDVTTQRGDERERKAWTRRGHQGPSRGENCVFRSGGVPGWKGSRMPVR